MPKADGQTTKDKLTSPSKSLKPIPSRLIDFIPRPQIQSMENRYSERIQRNNFESHQLNKKINKMLRLSFMPGNKNGDQLKKSTQRMDISLCEGMKVNSKDVRKQQIFSIPKIIKNINVKLSQYGHNNTEENLTSPQKLFKEEEDYLHKLKTKAKFSTFKRQNDILASRNTEPLENTSVLQDSINKETDIAKKFERTTDKEPISYRSKTMHVEAENCPDKSFSFSCKKVMPVEVEEQKIKEQLKNANGYYEKFQKYCRFTQNDHPSHVNKQFIPTNLTTYKHSEKTSSRKNSTKNQRLTEIHQAYSPEFKHNRSKQPKQFIKNIIKNQFHPSQSPLHGSNLIPESRTKFKVMIKSNSNNKGLSTQKKLSGQKRITHQQTKKSKDLKKRIINFQPQETYTNQTIKFINLTSYEQNNKSEENANFSWRAERIHHPSTQKIEMNRTESKKSTKKSRYLHFERNMKLSNNIHIVITESSKTKINIFHNSLLLKQDPQKMQALTSLVRDASKHHGQTKIEVPTELQINKLKIEEKKDQLSGRESRKEIETQLREGMKKEKQKRKQSVPRARTEKKYQIVLEDVKPWEISDQRDLQESHHTSLNDNEFTYLNSKTII